MERIHRVYVFGNGQVMVFNQWGRQMPDYQGSVAEVGEKLRAAYDGPWLAAQWPALSVEEPQRWT